MVLSGALLTHMALTPPTPEAKAAAVEKFGKPDIGTRIGRRYGSLMRPIFWALVLCEVLVVIASHYPSASSTHILDILVPITASSAAKVRVTPVFFVGWALMCSGSLLRLLCFRTLGRFFTFELSVQEGHKLVTWGPYSVVRHPSYTGTLMVASGNLIASMGVGSWWRECGLIHTPAGKVMAVMWMMSFLPFFVSVPIRISKEDRIFRKEFGTEWDAWAKKTPNKLIPFVY